MESVIEVSDLHFAYRDGTTALRGVSFSLEPGSKVALLGSNGAGKSTLLLHLNGLFLPQQGIIRVLGREINKKTELWVRQKVGIVFQDPDDQVFSSTVWEDVAFGPLNMGFSSEEVTRRVNWALEVMGIQHLQEKPPHNLSYGQKKRVAIAGVLALDPEIVIMDEPMAFLDPRGQEDLKEILEWLHEQGKTLIVATHDVDFAAAWAETVLVMKNGVLLREGTRELLTDEKIIEEAGLRLPLVVQIFRQLGIDTETRLPLSVEEAVRQIRMLLER
ncbi:ATP-binding cassette domain-containing protein [Calderihabitans maritimus]|uniref:ABC transporter ATP-binding protein n=1 Tax=Calderihabitans maritimus TaxID=1246530 RepID=A0A1Z5HTR6_9FIRM|nr:ATP-binding cassette domain-containing protein [Calderihabitans maritimus]GAW92727.1 cobalt ABC transporter ATPase [Calderihabitans maritimus]